MNFEFTPKFIAKAWKPVKGTRTFKMKKTFVFYCLLFYTVLAQTPLFETPNAIAAYRGEYHVTSTFYRDGGMNMRVQLALTDRLALGIVQYIDGVIGDNSHQFTPPGVLGKFTLTLNPPEAWNMAFGYDALYTGSYPVFEKKAYGFYGVISKGFFLLADYPHLFQFGLSAPVTGDELYPFLFTSLELYLFQSLRIGSELNGLHFQTSGQYDLIHSHVIITELSELFELRLAFQWAGKNKVKEDLSASYWDWDLSRNIRLVYKNYF